MKKLILSVGIMSLSAFAYAQKSEVAEAKKAWDLFQAMNSAQSLQKNLDGLNKGLGHTDLAIAHEKTKNTVEPWALRASLASAVALLDTISVENATAKQKIAEEAIVKAEELDKKGEQKDNIANAKINIANAVQSRGIRAYNKKDFATAFKIFTEITEKNPTDTSMYLNAGVAAKQAGNYAGAVKNFKKVVELNAPDAKNLMLEAINIELVNLKDTTAAMASIDQALAKFPDDPDFVGTQTDIYIVRGEIEKSQGSLNKLIAKDPNKAIYQFLLGETYYKQALAVQTERQKIDPKKVKEYNAATAKMTALIDQSLPYYKKAYELDPKAVHTLEALKQVYGFKNDTKNYEETKKLLDAIQKK
ncbi:tetratricopeptide repeat protein [Pedobacter ureilyticus]|jgi:tetratricopeptide (TPR) repeat protein|uniref:Tetratricopeptide repeat protein n=1 Tax=Pedobacter ureilyticus TaxID=1393051 RepID=A0ABW9J762_9SPHI|nr:tetratricopeptide repeat protein [Pedobacter helvus]